MNLLSQYQRNTRGPFIEVQRQNYRDLLLTKDYKTKALYAGKDGHIFLETFTKYYKEISDFLIAIGEPVHRTKNIHEFSLTKYSLYAAASMNIKTNDILVILSNLSKNELPNELIEHIKKNTETYGKIRLLLKSKRYFIECNNRDILMKILQFNIIFQSYQKILDKRKRQHEGNNNNSLSIHNDMVMTVNMNNDMTTDLTVRGTIKNIMGEGKQNEEIDDIPSFGENYFEIDPENLEEIKRYCIEQQYPLLEEYDFKNDRTLPSMDINPKLRSPARGYQEKALGIMFSNERARSGIIVLPCGAGKTLIGILATVTIKKNTIILCNSAVSVEQWYREVKNWALIKPEDNVARLTSKKKDKLWNLDENGGVLIVSYTMMAYTGKRNPEIEIVIEKIRNTEWGLMILDEVQVLPANMFRKILSIIKSHCKLGLTATLVREDRKIEDLNFLIGPKHYEANWIDLQRDGYLARVKCIEIWCEMTVDFYEEYLHSDSAKKKKLYVANPNKLFICKALINKHKQDKIIIFSDDLFTLNNYALELKCHYISGKVNENERNKLLEEFRNGDLNCLLMSKVGDTSLDLPNAKVIIQISSHFGSRRQEAQRLGRILRPKKDVMSEYNAFFYTIISKNTEEMYFSNKRHKFLVDQGYYFKVVTDLKKELDIHEVTINPYYCEKVLNDLKSFNLNDKRFEDDISIDNDFIDEDIAGNKDTTLEDNEDSNLNRRYKKNYDMNIDN